MENNNKSSALDRIFTVLALTVSVVLCVFHLLAASPMLTLNNTEQAVIHGAMVVTFFLLVRHLKFKGGKFIDLALIAVTIIAAFEVIAMRNSNSASATLYSVFQQRISIVFVIVALIVGYRALGKILPSLCVLFLAYTLLGRYLPGTWATAKVSLTRMSTYLMVSSEGLFGNALSTAANFIFLFVIFGSVLSFIGAGEFFVKIAFAAFGKICGGPAQAAVYSSMLMGMVNGSGAANVVTTGTFTIPLMKQTGFDSDTAGAIEAVASNGGQIMPPVMGAVAFLMADATSLPYTVICLAALLPAILYYITLSTSIVAYSHRNKIPVKAPDPNAETVWQIFKSGWFYFLPIFLLIALMVKGFSTQRAALITIILCAIIGLLTDRKKFTAKNLLDLCEQSAKSIMTVSIACMIAGIIVGSINITGFGLKISGLITAASGGRIIIMGVLTAIVCIILGMGLPTSACYIVLAVLVAPAMIELGIATISAHMFVLYYGVVAAITPPVALAVFAAIGISHGDMWKTGLQAMKMAASGFVIPFIFLYNTDLLMFNPITNSFGFSANVVVSFITAMLGCMIMALGLFGWFFRDFKLWERILLLVCAVCLMLNEPFVLNVVGLAVAVVVLIRAKATAKKEVLI
ncbi:MAG: TRAP transporter fused permease subunit [Lachnospiraceae bacterium]|nr:TRAP transporter fused permease subunit [Lachnospiraceae bacterium]